MNSRTEWRWRLALILLIAVALLGILAIVVRADSIYVHGIVQDGAYRPVRGGHIRFEYLYFGQWDVEVEDRSMQSHSFGWELTKPGQYRTSWFKPGWEVVGEILQGKFTLPGGAPAGDIQVNVRRVTVIDPAPTATLEATATLRPTFPVPTTLYPPTVDPTATPTATPNAAVSYITLAPEVEDTLERHVVTALSNYVPATCFEIAAREKACPMSVTQAWVAMVPEGDGVECYRFQPFSCPRRAGVLIAARCQSPCDVAIIEGGEW